jgi:predicted nucleic-acid-binding protein
VSTAVDTNVLVRIITNDDLEQSARAAAFLRTQSSVFVASTVILELEWVLRSAYNISAKAISAAIRRIVAMPNAEIEDEALVTKALAWYDHGMDFADSLHLAGAKAQEFATFDLALRRRAHRLGIRNLVHP